MLILCNYNSQKEEKTRANFGRLFLLCRVNIQTVSFIWKSPYYFHYLVQTRKTASPILALLFQWESPQYLITQSKQKNSEVSYSLVPYSAELTIPTVSRCWGSPHYLNYPAPTENNKANSSLALYSAGLNSNCFRTGKFLIISIAQSTQKNNNANSGLAPYSAGLKFQLFPAVGRFLLI
jgi:hypothetical protein